MTRRQIFKWAAVAAAVVSIGATWNLVGARGQSRAPGAISAPNNVLNPVPNLPANYGYVTQHGSGNWIYSTVPENDPEMAKLAESEMELAHHADEVLSQYGAAEKADDQKRLKAELRDVLAKQFDVQRQRRDLELSRIEERVKKLREQIKKRNDARETIIDRRLEQLATEAEGLGWGQPAGGAAFPQPRANYPLDFNPAKR